MSLDAAGSMTRTTPDMLAEAAAAVEYGWMIFPVAGKVPRTRRGVLDATRCYKTIDTWHRRGWLTGIAVATGAPSGAWVLDIDGEDGEAWLRAMTREYGPLPDTVEALTRRGRHLWWRMPADGDVRCSAGQVAPGVDVRGTGGYVVIPPSPHPDGGRYAWEASGHPDDVAVAHAPDWLLRAVTAPDRASAMPAPPIEDTIPEGRRNRTLASIAGTLRRRGLSAVEIHAAIAAVNAHRCRPPLPDRDIERIARSVARYPAAAPTTYASHSRAPAAWAGMPRRRGAA